MRRIEASRRNASALRLRFSQSFASLRQQLSQAKVRSTIQRRGSTTNPFVRSERLTISVSSCGKIFAKASAPGSHHRQRAFSRKGTSRKGSQEAGCRHRDLGYRQDERWREAANPACLREYGASCP